VIVADETETEKPGKQTAATQQVSVLITVIGMLVTGVLGGSGGSYLTGNSVSTAIREGQIRQEAALQALRDEVRRLGDDQRASLVRLDGVDRGVDARLRAVELRLERLDPRSGAPR
jgi:hypothetical protein